MKVLGTPSPALAPFVRYIDRLPEPDRSVFVHDLRLFLARRPDVTARTR